MNFLTLILILISATCFAQRTGTIDADCLRITTSGVCIDKDEFESLNDIDSNIQAQLDDIASDVSNKQDTITGAATSIVSSDLTTSRALQSDGSGKVSSSSITSSELGYLSGTTSNIQTQIEGKVAGQSSSVDGEVMLFNLTSGKQAKRATGTGFAKLSSGVLSTAASIDVTTDLTGSTPVSNGGTGTNSLDANNVILGNGTSAVTFVAPGSSGNILTSDGTTWVSSAGSSTTPTVQKFLSGSGTYTTPANVRYIRVRMVGGGGGGGGSGTTNGTAATDGGATTFGTSLLSAGGGLKGARASNGGAGGTASLGTGPTGLAINGGVGRTGGGYAGASSTAAQVGGGGADSVFGGGGSPGSAMVSLGGSNATTNTGAGGGGAATDVVNNGACGSGGGSGAYVDAIISSPSSTYAYAVGAGGTGQAAGTSGGAGGNGAAGLIIVEEYY
jgi:hypothetical protein